MAALDGPMLEATLRLVELQADAGTDAGDRGFTGYVSNVLFDDWDEVWAGAPRAGARAGVVCARLRRWLQPVWGLRLPPADYTHNDLNLSNILTDGTGITGVVDWDEFGLGSRALDLVVLALDAERLGNDGAADRLLARAAQIAGDDGLRCLVSYRAIAGLAHLTQERQAYGDSLADALCEAILAILDRLQATDSDSRRQRPTRNAIGATRYSPKHSLCRQACAQTAVDADGRICASARRAGRHSRRPRRQARRCPHRPRPCDTA